MVVNGSFSERTLSSIFSLDLNRIVRHGKTVKEIYQETLRNAVGIVEEDGDCPSLIGSSFPPPLEEFFNDSILRENISDYGQIIKVPAFSYYCNKFKTKVSAPVLYFLWKATVPNALVIKDDDITGYTPMSMLVECLDIVNGQWASQELIKVYKDMVISLNADSPNSLYRIAMDQTRASRMKDNNYFGGVSNMLQKLCVWYNKSRVDSELSLLIQAAFPSYVTLEAVLEWGNRYSVITPNPNEL
jgi:hypothetical protein